LLRLSAATAIATLVPSSPLHAEEPRAAIEAADRLWEAAVSKGDAAALAALYTANAQLLPPNSEAITGTAAIQKFWQGFLDSGIRVAKLKTLEVEALGNSAHEVGEYEVSGQGGQLVDRGKYVVIWKRDGPRWKLHRDIWTTSQPPHR
jgi:ketosteroid isomerase-like protein